MVVAMSKSSKSVRGSGASVKGVKPVVSVDSKVDVAKKSSSSVVTPSVKVSNAVVVESVGTSASSFGKPSSISTGKSVSGVSSSSVGSSSSGSVNKLSLSSKIGVASVEKYMTRVERDWNRSLAPRKLSLKSYEGKTYYLNGCPLNGDRPLLFELERAFGIGMSLSKWLCMETGIHPMVKVGRVSSSLKKMEKLLAQHKLVIGSELRRSIMKNVSLHMSMGTNRGIRMRSGLPTRGQRTSTNGRTAKRLNGHRGGSK